ncbi:MAG: hypothetical protein ACRDGF_09640, partial [Chloroflexota bacterium]
MNPDRSFRFLTAVAGAVGVSILIASFIMNPGPPPGADLAFTLGFARQHATTIALAGWMQGMGSVLNVLFALGLMQIAGAGRKLSGWLTLLSGAGILATSLAECGLYFAAVAAGKAGDTSTLLTALTLIKGLQHVYLIVPALLLPVGWTVFRSRILPPVFGCMALAIGAALQVLGIAGVLDALQPVVDTVLIVQGVWF